MANLKRAEYGKVDLDYVLGIGGFDLERFISFYLVFTFRIHIETGRHEIMGVVQA